MTAPHDVEGLLRELAPRVLGVLVRRHGDFGRCEDATQEAMAVAAERWAELGPPERPLGWLVTVASRRLVDAARRDGARRRREELASTAGPTAALEEDQRGRDDSLTLLVLCCHPSLSPPSQVALTLRAVGGLTTAEIARAFLVPEATMAQRISRAKRTIADAGARFELPSPPELVDRLASVRHVLYLIFTEGHTASSGTELQRHELAGEALRLARLLHRTDPEDETGGLLALMLLTHARSPARVDRFGGLVPLAEQDRSRWDRAMIDEGVALLETVLPRGRVGPYQLQAAIAAVHDEAPNDEETDWPQVLGLYDLLLRLGPDPIVSLNRAVALAKVAGPRAGLDELDALERDRRMASHHRLAAVRAHLLEQLGDHERARSEFRRAARGATGLAERRHLERRAARLVSR
ncbi:MAG: RNA polymerase sigma factor [Acidimicrobiales bacterium]